MMQMTDGRVLNTFPHPSKRSVVSCSFSNNGKTLALQGTLCGFLDDFST
jgi:hypothetical protein